MTTTTTFRFLPLHPLRKSAKNLRNKCEKTPLIEDNALRDKIVELQYDTLKSEQKDIAELCCLLIEDCKQFKISLAYKTDTEPDIFLIELYRKRYFLLKLLLLLPF